MKAEAPEEFDQTVEEGGGRKRRLDLLVGGLAVVVVVAVYARVAGLGIMLGWDDELYLLRRVEAVDWFGATWRQRLLTPKLGYPVPLPTFVYYLVMELPEGVRLAAAHLTNLGFHALNTALVYALARRWLAGRGAALVASTIWAVHPLMVESVAWLTDLKQLMFASCVLGGMWVWRYQLNRQRWATAVATVGLAVLAFGCRPEAVVFGPVLAAQTWWRAPGRITERRVWGPIAGIAAIACMYFPVAYLGHSTAMAAWNDPSITHLPAGERVQNFFAALALQLRHVVWPVDLEPYYVADFNWHSYHVWAGALLYPALFGATAATLRRRSPGTPGWILFWAFWLPASGIVYLPRFTADTYMYLPLAGLTVVAVGALNACWRPDTRRQRIVAGLCFIAMVAGLGWRSRDQIGRWENTVTLYEPLTRKHPEKAHPHLVLAWHYANSGQWEQARSVVEKGLDAMYAHGSIPLGLLKVFERTGDPRTGARVALEMYRPRYPATPPAEVGQYLTWLIARHRLAVAPDAEIRRIVATRALQAIPYARRQWSPGLLRQAARHFSGQALPGVAARYARAVVLAAPEACSGWQIWEKTRRQARRAGEDVGLEDGPERPAACGE